MNYLPFRRISTLLDSATKNPNSTPFTIPGNLKIRNWNPIPLPHRTIPEPKGQDLDYVNVAYSYLVHSDWTKLDKLVSGLTPFRVKHVLLKVQKDHVVSLEFFKWVELRKPNSHTLEMHSIVLHILTKNRKFKSAESILKKIHESSSIEFPSKLFETILYSYRLCDSSPFVFDCLFKTYAHMKKFRNATDTFCRMKDYGFLPTVESCNAYMSSLINLNRTDIALRFYKEMQRSRISPNVYTLNMVIDALCKSGKLEKAFEVFREMENMGFNPTVVSYNTLIAGNCNQGLLSTAMKLKNLMEKNGCHPNDVTYNILIHGFCRDGKLIEANKLFTEMKNMNMAPNIITYNTLINGYSQVGNSEMGRRLHEEMSRNGIKADILTYNALILGLCKEGRTKKAAYLVKEFDKENLIPNSSTFSALIMGQCVRKKSERAFQLYKSMIKTGCHPNEHTFKFLMSTFCKNEDFDGAVQVLREMLKRSIAPDSGILSEICCGLRLCGQAELVLQLCKEIEARHLMPEGFEKAKIISCKPGIESKSNEDDL
ncbi:pentatricopeptide repeat-containing protein At4g26680, mitochondrial isoform X1 [Cornus florida]|uniref:pentatricopeptide repeat-containing protein At4g26680, mitochondrial isoform X1 n=1 Tax=Cornus florida TaxID=4283 RepID=UPI002899FB3C|nr:pentatricopeptide repeat-containing protein At4g26680, mitochondrial isoform X1 [Cornus florida]XP_059662879.1 pentatricopeptide repeat-containing protein At4g26680, mitochondrial isoform X1 [Cornus florida]XP_059662880.1 pentatricopeptide repeat-containing protein At4g26680, mitochondrial isoform X2 [Cornus florida]XP_059662881.1 pentatricopeptide repeat-containing protein At4g26680, mitochondrial isoform X1 [Cornus florida]